MKTPQDLLPHRDPFLFVDDIELDVEAQRAVGHWTPADDWSVFSGHFPENPMVPGVILLEAMSQTACILGESLDPSIRNQPVLLVAIDKARFRRPVGPGQKISSAVQLAKRRLGIWKFEGTASVDGHLVAEATLSAASGRRHA